MTCRMLKTRVDVGFFEVGKVLEDLLGRHPAGKISSTSLTVIRIPRIVRFSTAHVRFDRDRIDLHVPLL